MNRQAQIPQASCGQRRRADGSVLFRISKAVKDPGPAPPVAQRAILDSLGDTEHPATIGSTARFDGRSRWQWGLAFAVRATLDLIRGLSETGDRCG